MRDSRLPTISAYMHDHVDSSKDWVDGSYACPFHNEQKGKSFSIKGNVWRCFGQCQCGGDVVELHRFNNKMRTREEAERSLFILYHLNAEHEISFERPKVEADEVVVQRKFMYNKALRCATNPERWIELDYILSKVPYDVKELEMFCYKYEQS